MNSIQILAFLWLADGIRVFIESENTITYNFIYTDSWEINLFQHFNNILRLDGKQYNVLYKREKK